MLIGTPFNRMQVVLGYVVHITRPYMVFSVNSIPY